MSSSNNLRLDDGRSVLIDSGDDYRRGELSCGNWTSAIASTIRGRNTTIQGRPGCWLRISSPPTRARAARAEVARVIGIWAGVLRLGRSNPDGGKCNSETKNPTSIRAMKMKKTPHRSCPRRDCRLRNSVRAIRSSMAAAMTNNSVGIR